jgi:hypothetical protein
VGAAVVRGEKGRAEHALVAGQVESPAAVSRVAVAVAGGRADDAVPLNARRA